MINKANLDLDNNAIKKIQILLETIRIVQYQKLNKKYYDNACQGVIFLQSSTAYQAIHFQCKLPSDLYQVLIMLKSYSINTTVQLDELSDISIRWPRLTLASLSFVELRLSIGNTIFIRKYSKQVAAYTYICMMKTTLNQVYHSTVDSKYVISTFDEY